MRLKVLACKLLYREISLLTATSEHIIDTTYLRQGFHDTPSLLRSLLQKEIDMLDQGEDVYSYLPDCEAHDFDAILLGYGLCSNAVAGLTSQKYKIVVPRAHDCATLLLGSKDMYKSIFDSGHGGIYWYSAGWNENSIMPSKFRVEQTRAEYEEKYGEDNAEYLMEMEQNWLKEYKHCMFIDWASMCNEKHIAYTKECADYLGWEYKQLAGDDTLMRDFLSGNWDDTRFQVIQPGKKLMQSFDENVFRVGEANEVVEEK